MIKEKINHYNDLDIDSDSDDESEEPIVINRALEEIHANIVTHWAVLIKNTADELREAYDEYKQRFSVALAEGKNPQFCPLYRAEGEAFIKRSQDLNKYIDSTGLNDITGVRVKKDGNMSF